MFIALKRTTEDGGALCYKTAGLKIASDVKLLG